MPIVTLPKTCEGCGGCCWYHAEVAPGDDTPEELTEIDSHDGKRYMRRTKELWCVALDLDTKRCTIYDKRPTICREFEAGTKQCFNGIYQMRQGFMRTERDRFRSFFRQMGVRYDVVVNEVGERALRTLATDFCFNDAGRFMYTRAAPSVALGAVGVREDEETED